jgi:acyl transferase domain-containing protein
VVAEQGDAGQMAAVRAGEAEVRRILQEVGGYVAVANLNSPTQTVVSGESDAVRQALQRLAESGIDSRALPIAAAFHSKLAEPAQAGLAEALARISLTHPRIPALSTVTGEFMPETAAAIRKLLVDQLCAPVDFVSVVRRLYDHGARTFVEVGPKRVLTPFVSETLAGLEHVAISVNQSGVGGREQLVHVLDELRPRGAAVPADVQPTEGLVTAAMDALRRTGFPLERGRLPVAVAGRTAVIYANLGARVKERARLEQAKRAAATLRQRYLDRLAEAVSVEEQLAADRWFADEQAELWTDSTQADTGEKPAAELIADAIGAAGLALDLDATSPADSATAVARLLVDGGRAEAVIVFSGSDGDPQCTIVGSPPAQAEPQPESAPAAAPADAVAEAVLAAFSEATGYERELLGLDLDLEGELGIDSIMQAQILAQLADRFELPLDPEQFRPGDFPTLRHVIEYAAAHAPAAEPAPAHAVAEAALVAAADAGVDTRVALAGSPILRFAVSSGSAPLIAEQPNFTIGAGWNVAVVAPPHPHFSADALMRALANRGARPVRVELRATSGDANAALRRRLERTRALAGRFEGVVFLHDGAASKAAPAKALFRILQVAAEDLRAAAADGRAFVAAVGPSDPDGAAVAGLLKSAAKELPGVVVKAIGLENETPMALVHTVLSEVELGGTRVEVAYTAGERRVSQLVACPPERLAKSSLELDASSVLLLIGGGRGITAEIAKQLAHSFRPTFVVWGTSVLDDESFAAAGLDEEELRRLRQQYLERASARKPKAPPRVLDEEFQRLLRAVETQRTLQGLVELGARTQYRTVSVRDAGAVASAVRALRDDHGRLDGVVFAAGIIEDKLLQDKRPESFDRVLDVKARGLPNLANALAEIEPQFVAAFSSVVGVLGNRGQTDYAAANAFVDRFMSLEAARRQGRWFSIAWGPWAEVGLAARSGTGALAAERGLALIGPAEGAKAFELELMHGNKPMVVLSGRLGTLDEDDAASGLFDEVKKDGESRIVASRTFTLARDPWLADHVIGGVPVVPGTVELELLVQAASELVPGHRFTALENLLLHRPVKLLRGEPATVHVRAERDGDREGAAAPARIRVALESTVIGPDGTRNNRVHCEALVELAADGPSPRPLLGPAPAPESVLPHPEIYAPGGPLPLGPALHVLERVSIDGALAVGEVRTANGAWRRAAWGREAAVQTAGLHAIVQHGIAALPAGCTRLEHFTDIPPGVLVRTEAHLRAVRKKEVEYDIDLVGADGLVYERLLGYRATRLQTFA